MMVFDVVDSMEGGGARGRERVKAGAAFGFTFGHGLCALQVVCLALFDSENILFQCTAFSKLKVTKIFSIL